MTFKNLWLRFCLVVGNWPLTGNEQRFLLVSDPAALLAAAPQRYRPVGLAGIAEGSSSRVLTTHPRNSRKTVCVGAWGTEKGDLVCMWVPQGQRHGSGRVCVLELVFLQ